MPEATILGRQLQAELVGKTVAGFDLRDCEKLQRMGFVNEDPCAFERLVGRDVESAKSRGNTILVTFSGQQNLILSPEYGGEVLYHEKPGSLPVRYHLRLDMSDGSALTVRMTSMGGIYTTDDEGLSEHYMIQRDFDLDRPQPNDDLLTPRSFSQVLAGANRQLKPVLVGKDAVVVGLSNSAFQDILYRAGIHPRRRASELSPEETKALYEALSHVVEECLRLGGKVGFRDLYGRPGGYQPAMGPGMKGADCPVCASPIRKLSLGGGDVYLCPRCQREGS
jgi:formamidopyrimidine-DNA glycosylase